MFDIKITYGKFVKIIAVGLVLFAVGCNNLGTHKIRVVFTEIPVLSVDEDLLKSQDFKYISGMKIVIANLELTTKNVEILTGDFHSARAAEISYDGKMMIFSGQKSERDVWQIWKMPLDKNEIVQITHSKQNCTDPVWLPNGGVAYSKVIESEISNLPSLKFHGLFSCNLDGSNEQRITFQPHEDVNAGMLNDGRLLVNSKQVYPEVGELKFLAIHPDGTKAELFYPALNSAKSMSKAWESADRKLIFVESGQLVTITFNRPLNSRKVVGNANQVEFLSAFPVSNNLVLVALKKPTERTFGLSILDIQKPETNSFYFNDASYHMVEPVIVRQRPVPKKLPSIVNMEKNSGTFICMDADKSTIEITEGVSAKIQVVGLNRILGETKVEEDGSFYLELEADRPVRFQTLNENGELLRGPSSWMWVRPNEKRGCVGCHEDREMAPDNLVPLAIKNFPVSLTKQLR